MTQTTAVQHRCEGFAECAYWGAFRARPAGTLEPWRWYCANCIRLYPGALPGNSGELFDVEDERDAAIHDEGGGAYLALTAPSVGDFVDFDGGRTWDGNTYRDTEGALRRRISHVWPADWHDDGIARLQTSDGGSFYLERSGHASFSGGLYGSIPADKLTLTGEVAPGHFWFFRHDQHRAHNGIDVYLPGRIWQCAERGPR